MDKNTEQLIAKALAETQPRPLHRVLFNLAESYNQISEQAFKTIEAKKNADFGAPAIMCKSFAIELLLKFFYRCRLPSSIFKSRHRHCKCEPSRPCLLQAF